jgi:hypothetical protein
VTCHGFSKHWYARHFHEYPDCGLTTQEYVKLRLVSIFQAVHTAFTQKNRNEIRASRMDCCLEGSLKDTQTYDSPITVLHIPYSLCARHFTPSVSFLYRSNVSPWDTWGWNAELMRANTQITCESHITGLQGPTLSHTLVLISLAHSIELQPRIHKPMGLTTRRKHPEHAERNISVAVLRDTLGLFLY